MRAEKVFGSMPRVCMMMALCAAVQGCSGSTGTIPGTQGATGGGTSNPTGGKSSTVGTIGSGGAVVTGGNTSTGGRTGTGGTTWTGGATAAGGNTSSGTGGATAAGGNPGSGTGGAVVTGGNTSTGGRTGTGGSTRTGSATATGGNTGSDTGGKSSTGGTLGSGGAGTAPKTCTSSQPVPKTGDQTVTLQYGGRSRSYILHAPSGLSAGNPLALVIDLHGAGGTGKQQQGMSGFSALSDTEKFLVVFPNGIDGYWNVDDTCCGTAGKEKIDDVGFLKAIIEKLNEETCIDVRRIYVSGFSNGGGLAHRMGCDAADVIAAIAPTATDLRTQPCNAARPISMMEIKGMVDSLEPYEGGVVGPAGGQYTDVGAKQSLKLWADINQCTGTTTKIDTYCESYTQCAGGVETDLCSLPNTDHNTYSNSLGFKVASVVWSMFKRHPAN